MLNQYVETQLIESFKKAKYFTLFHDETTDVSNHSEAGVIAMFWHLGEFKEHYIGMIHMTEGLTALKHYQATLNLFSTILIVYIT